MRRSYMSPEYNKNDVNGTLNMIEESNFFSSKMLEIEDNLIVDNIDIFWYQNDNKEQLDLSVESTYDSYLYSPSKDKQDNLTLNIDKTNTDLNSVKWVFEINIKKLLTNYLYATLKKYRTFEGVKNTYTIYNDVDDAIYNYINQNIINRYRYKRIDFFISFLNIKDNQLKYKNNWNPSLSKDYISNNYQLTINSDESVLKLILSQLNSDEYIFDYYYNIEFERI